MILADVTLVLKQKVNCLKTIKIILDIVLQVCFSTPECLPYTVILTNAAIILLCGDNLKLYNNITAWSMGKNYTKSETRNAKLTSLLVS